MVLHDILKAYSFSPLTYSELATSQFVRFETDKTLHSKPCDLFLPFHTLHGSIMNDRKLHGLRKIRVFSLMVRIRRVQQICSFKTKLSNRRAENCSANINSLSQMNMLGHEGLLIFMCHSSTFHCVFIRNHMTNSCLCC